MPTPNRPQGSPGFSEKFADRCTHFLYTFDDMPDTAHLLPYVDVADAYHRNRDRWISEYGLAPVPNHGYTSEAIFVPMPAVEQAIAATRRLATPTQLKAL